MKTDTVILFGAPLSFLTANCVCEETNYYAQGIYHPSKFDTE